MPIKLYTAGELGTFRGGSGFPIRFQGGQSGELPFFKVSDMNRPGNEVFMRRANNYITEFQRKAMGAVRMPAGSIVFAKVGAAVFLERKRILAQDSCIDNNMAAFRVDESRVSTRYAHYLLTAFKMSDLVATTALPSLNGGQLRSIPLLVPGTLEEQRLVVNALRDVDEISSALERMITKKRAVKQSMMQQLLTGKVRLSGFAGTWNNAEVGDLLAFKNGLNKGGEYFGAGSPIVNFMDVINGPIITAEDVDGRVTLTKDEIGRFSARCGDMFFTRTSETVGEVGTAATLIDDICDAAFSGFLLRGRPKTAELDPRFMAHLFQLDVVRQQIMSSATYTTRALTNGRSLSRIFIRLPDVKEQRAIADLVADVDREIAVLCRRHEKAGAIKQGMMQELLTGRTRLPAQGAAA